MRQSDRPQSPQDMVGWYDPRQLVRTGTLVLVSTQFAIHADNREVQAIANKIVDPFDYSRDPENSDFFWFDFVADCGDGWNSTYAVASTLARHELKLRLPDGRPCPLERGRLLIFGGDLVYPTPSGRAYD